MGRDFSKVDPNATPIQMDQRQMAHLPHPEARNGLLTYDKFSLMLNLSIPGQGPPITNDKPIKVVDGKWVNMKNGKFSGDPEAKVLIDRKFLNRDQPLVGTCSRPTPENKGCFSHNGCPYTDPEDPRGRGPGPFNVIMVGPDGQKQPCPCYHFYHGTNARGFPTSQVHYAYNGHKVDTSTTSIPSNKSRAVRDEFGEKRYEDVPFEQQVENLGPMYEHLFTGAKPKKLKPEKNPLESGEVMPDTPMMVNARAGGLADAPRVQAPPTVKIG